MDSRGKQKTPLHLNGSKEGILDLLLRFTQSHSTHAQYRQRGTTIELHRSHHFFQLLLLLLLTPTTCELRLLQQQSITPHRIIDQEAPNTPRKIMKKKSPQTQRSMMEKNVAPLLQQTSNQLGVFPIIMKMLRTRRERRNSTSSDW